MSVLKIEEYTQQNGVDILKVYCKPTKNFPDGKNFFYAPAEAIDVVKAHGWYINPHGRYGVAIIAKLYTKGYSSIYYFHRELFKMYHNYNCNVLIDHCDLVEFDNIDENLNLVDYRQNRYNCLRKGYNFTRKTKCFKPTIHLDGNPKTPYNSVITENEACVLQNELEQVWLKEKLGNDWYMFDFKKYRRGSEDILDLERTGQISEEEAIYRHILKYSENAWYMLRYGLEEYYKENHIPIPKYSLDADGFMIHPITGQKLCPFAK